MYKVSTKIIFMAVCAVVFCMTAATQAALMTSGTVYKTVHEDGTITYSDQASPDAVEVVLNVPTSTITSKMQTPTIQTQQPTSQKINHKVSILSPQPEATIRNNVGEISIGATIEPKAAGFFQLHINEEVHESATGMFRLKDMNRGTYQYSVKFIDNSGKVIASSDIRNVYLHQASALIN